MTRIEIDGFKSLDAFAVDLPPFAVILGPNASGKSNLFDALRFLSELATHPVVQAAESIRGLPHELFSIGPNDRLGERIRIAAELLLDPVVDDPFGSRIELTHTRIRYEVELERTDRGGVERVQVRSESAVPILARDDRWRPFGRSPSDAFRTHHCRYKRKSPFLTTSVEAGGLLFTVKQDGHQGRDRRVRETERTLLSTMTDSTFPHLYAVRTELSRWFPLQLDPVAMHAPASTLGSDLLEPDGANLARVLWRIYNENPNILNQIVADLSEIVEGVRGLSIGVDPAARTVRVELETGGGTKFSSRVLSDGTLRLIALFTLLTDPRSPPVVFMEEPENGVHPVRLKALVDQIRSYTTDPHADEPDPSLRQVLLNSHSPVVLDAVRDLDGAALFFDTVVRADDTGVVRRTRARTVYGSDQIALIDEDSLSVSSADVRHVLSTVRSGP